MSRTERYRTQTKTDLTMGIDVGDVVSYCQMQEIINVCNDIQKDSSEQRLSLWSM